MTALSNKFRAAILGVACIAGVVGCSKAPSAKLEVAATTAAVMQPAAPVERDDPATTPNDPALRGFWLTYGEVDKRADLNYDRNLQSEDGQPVSSVTISYPKSIPDASEEDFGSMQVRNKALLDFMSACLGPDNAKAITQMSEGRIMVYTTPLKLSNTVEITTVTPGKKGHTTEAVLACQDKGGLAPITAAVAKLKAGTGF
jgi:hypothetical protein